MQRRRALRKRLRLSRSSAVVAASLAVVARRMPALAGSASTPRAAVSAASPTVATAVRATAATLIAVAANHPPAPESVKTPRCQQGIPVVSGLGAIVAVVFLN
jgi:hypothetical protein